METIQQKFEKMCEYINTGENGFFFPYIISDLVEELNVFTQDTDYPLLKEKMDNLIVLINKDHSMIDKDVTEELWDLI